MVNQLQHYCLRWLVPGARLMKVYQKFTSILTPSGNGWLLVIVVLLGPR